MNKYIFPAIKAHVSELQSLVSPRRADAPRRGLTPTGSIGRTDGVIGCGRRGAQLAVRWYARRSLHIRSERPNGCWM